MKRFSDVKEIDRSQIIVDPKLFQGRQTEYSEDTVKAIMAKGQYDKSAEPIVVWFDEDRDKYIVISGHSRWEAATRLFESGRQPDLKKMPVKVFLGDLDDAIDYATLESNRGSSEEGLISDLQAYKRAVERGYNREKLLSIFKPESKLKKLQELSYLNPKGQFIFHLSKESSRSFPYLERNARWVGQLRKMLPQLTDAHETELFDYFYRGKDKGLKVSKDQFMDLVDKRVNRIDFDPDNALNLENKVSSNALTDPITEQIKEIEQDINQMQKRIQKKRESIVKARESSLPDKDGIIESLQSDIRNYEAAIIRKLEEQNRLRQQKGKLERETVVDLFSNPAPEPKKEEPKKEKPKRKISSRKERARKPYKIGDLVNVSKGNKKHLGLEIIDERFEENDSFFGVDSWDYQVEMPDGKKWVGQTKWYNAYLEPYQESDGPKGTVINAFRLLDPEQNIYPLAAKAWSWSSMSPEKRGDSFMHEHEAQLKRYLQDFKDIAKKNGTESEVKGEFNRFAEKYRSFVRDYLYRQSNIASSMVAGPANFPVRQMEKRNNAQQNAQNKWDAWEKKAVKSIEKTLRNETSPHGDPRDELNVQKQKLESLKKTQEQYKKINAAYRKFKRDPSSLDKSDLSEATKEMIRTWKPQYSYEKAPILPWQMQNNNATIKRVESRVRELEAKSQIAESGIMPEVPFDGGVAVLNASENRIQLLFDEKPDFETRSKIKKAGFKWAPSKKAWQRMITDNALYATAYLPFIKHEGDPLDLFKVSKPKAQEPKKEGPKPLEVSKIQAKVYEKELQIVEPQRYEYHLLRRPPGIGTHPLDNFIEYLDDGSRHGLLAYSKPLPISELKRYELAPITDLKKYDGKVVNYLFGRNKIAYKVRVKKNFKGFFMVHLEPYPPHKTAKDFTYNGIDFLEAIQEGLIIEPKKEEPKPIEAPKKQPKYKVGDKVIYQNEVYDIGFVNTYQGGDFSGRYRLQQGPTGKQAKVYEEDLKPATMTDTVDLLENYEALPQEVQDLVFAKETWTKDQWETLNSALNRRGYDVDLAEDFTLIDLKKIKPEKEPERWVEIVKQNGNKIEVILDSGRKALVNRHQVVIFWNDKLNRYDVNLIPEGEYLSSGQLAKALFYNAPEDVPFVSFKDQGEVKKRPNYKAYEGKRLTWKNGIKGKPEVSKAQTTATDTAKSRPELKEIARAMRDLLNRPGEKTVLVKTVTNTRFSSDHRIEITLKNGEPLKTDPRLINILKGWPIDQKLIGGYGATIYAYYAQKAYDVIKSYHSPGTKEEKEAKMCPPMKDGKRLIDPQSIERLEQCINKQVQTKDLHTDKDGNYSLDRLKLHAKIIGGFKKGAQCTKGKKPIAILTGGAPGSGKSTFLKKYAPWLLSDKVYHIDADEVRAKLPEYEGWNASATHEETSDITKKLIEGIGRPCEYDLIYDGTMNKAKKYKPLVKQLKDLGYEVHVIYLQVPEEVSRKRVLERYQRSGRYVPMAVIDEIYQKGLEAYEEVIKSADGFIRVDGVTQEIIEEGGKKVPKRRKLGKTASKKEPTKKDQQEAKAIQKEIGEYLTLSEEQVLYFAEKLNSLRKVRSQVNDASQINKKVVPLTAEGLFRWAKNPGAFDLPGVDAPAAAKPTVKPRKIKKLEKPNKSAGNFWQKIWNGWKQWCYKISLFLLP